MPKEAIKEAVKEASKPSESKIIEGDGKDLESAMAMLSVPDLKEGKEEKKEEKQQEKKEEKQEGKKNEEGTLSDVFKEHIEEKEKPKAKKEDKKEDKQEDDKKVDLPELESPDVDFNTSQAIKDKMQRMHGQAKEFRIEAEKIPALEAKIKELEETKPVESQLTDFKETPEYKTISEENESLKAIVSKIGIEHSPEFKSKYDQPIEKLAKQVAPFLKTSGDSEKTSTLAAKLDSALSIKPGDEGDVKFYEIIGEISDELKGGVQAPFMTKMAQIRELANERAESIANVGDTSQVMEGIRLEGLESSKKASIENFNSLMETAEANDAMAIADYKKDPEIYQYEELTRPLIKVASEEVAKSVSAGMPTAKLLALAVNGTKYAFQSNLIQKYDKVVRNFMSTIEEQKAEIEKLGGSDGSGGKAPGKPTEGSGDKDVKDYDRGSGMADTIKELRESGKISS